MRFTCIVLALVSAALSTAATNVPIAARKTSLRESCTGGRVLNTTTVYMNGHDLKITTTSCSSFDGHTILPPAARAENVQKRQSDVCAESCTISCDVPNTTGSPVIDDCNQLTIALEGLSPETFLVHAQTVLSFEFDTCGVSFVNLDFVDLIDCYAGLGSNLAGISSNCFKDGPIGISGGFCFPIQVPSIRWGIEGYLV